MNDLSLTERRYLVDDEHPTALDEFLRANEETLGDETVADLIALGPGEIYSIAVGGGWAEWSLRRLV